MGIYINNTFSPAVLIKSGVVPSGGLSVSSNGTYNVYNYSIFTYSLTNFLYHKLFTSSTIILGEYVDNSATKINPYAFYNISITSISLPNVEEIGTGAFYSVILGSSMSFIFPKFYWLL